MGKNKEDMIENMEFLMSLLHKEWDRSGEEKVVLSLSEEDVERTKQQINICIYLRQQAMEYGDISFKKLLNLSHKNYILLRLARKVYEMDKKMKDGISSAKLVLSLDSEELAAYKNLNKK